MYEVIYSYSDGKTYTIRGVCATVLEFVLSEIESIAESFTVIFMEYPL